MVFNYWCGQRLVEALALIVLVADVVLGVAYYSTPTDDPYRKYYFPLIIGFLALIVVGLFFDRAFSNRNLSQTTSHSKEAQTIVLRLTD